MEYVFHRFANISVFYLSNKDVEIFNTLSTATIIYYYLLLTANCKVSVWVSISIYFQIYKKNRKKQ